MTNKQKFIVRYLMVYDGDDNEHVVRFAYLRNALTFVANLMDLGYKSQVHNYVGKVYDEENDEVYMIFDTNGDL